MTKIKENGQKWQVKCDITKWILEKWYDLEYVEKFSKKPFFFKRMGIGNG